MITNTSFIETAQQKQIKSLETELESVREDRRKLEATLLRTETVCNKLCHERDLLSKANEELRKTIETLQKKSETEPISVSELRRRNMQLEDRVQKLTQENAELAHKLETAINQPQPRPTVTNTVSPENHDPNFQNAVFNLTPEQSKEIDKTIESINSYIDRVFQRFFF